MRATFSLVLIAGGMLLATVPIIAHHAFAAEFSADKPVTLKGVVTKMEWVNPHSWVYVDVKRPDGTVEHWEVELGAPNALLRRGFGKDSLPPGKEITVQGFQAKNGLTMANGRDVTLPDGRRLFAGSSGTGAPGEPKK
jgi:hypothetical protein